MALLEPLALCGSTKVFLVGFSNQEANEELNGLLNEQVEVSAFMVS